jgi:hypothetical protein
MAYAVTLDVFSGRRNPSWTITSGEESAFLKRLQNAGKAFANKGPASKLGYRGLKLSSKVPGDTRASEILANAGAKNGSLYIVGSPELEQYLLSTSGSAVDNSVLTYVKGAIAQPSPNPPKPATTVTCPPCYAADAPAYNPGVWNVPAVQPYNNCYNYANNQQTDTFAQPGVASGHPMTGLSCGGVQPSAVSDGLNAVPDFSGKLTSGQGWYVALVVWPGQDFHWYRQDSNGCWSHKPGSTPVINTDDSGNRIADPQTCDRGSYTQFCSYMRTDAWVHIA